MSAAAIAAVLCTACADDFAPEQSAPSCPGGDAVTVVETGSLVRVCGPGASVDFEKANASLTLAGASLRVHGASGLSYTLGGTRQAIGSFQDVTSSSASATLTFQNDAGSSTVTVSFPDTGTARIELVPPAGATDAGLALGSPKSEAIYGLLERDDPELLSSEISPQEVGSLDRRGTQVPMQVIRSESLYTPFFQTSRGYGLWVEGTSIGNYDLCVSDPAVIDLDFELPPGVTSFAFDFFDGPGHDQILDRYTALAGRPFLPPKWAFLHWRWRDEHRLGTPALLDGVEANADLVDDVSHYESLGIPVGNYTIDRPWGTNDLPDLTEPEEPGFGDMIWDEQRFPNPQAMLDALNARGYHVFLWIGPWATGVTTHAEAEANGYLAPSSKYLVDFTNPDAVAWWKKKLVPLIKMGIAGFKLDRGDEDTPSTAADVYADGRTGRELANAYPVVFAKVHHDVMHDTRGDDFLNYPRAGYAGSQQWAGFSAGDVPGSTLTGKPTDLGLRSAILAVQHNAFDGFPIWGSDTGGYAEFGDREVFARWLEFSAFCPIMEIGGVGTHAPWDMPTQPNYDQELIDIYKRYVIIHHALAPYSYARAQEAHASGRPIAKPLVFDFPEDPRVKAMWQEFLYGDDILVAPVWKTGARSADVYIPEGRWVDYWNPSRVLEGPLDTSEDAPLDRIPIFVREGSSVLGTF